MTRSAASIGFVLGVVGIDALGFGLVVPVMPSLVEHIAGAGHGAGPDGAALLVGTLVAAFSTMQFFCAPLLGALSDRFGRRPVLLISLGGAVVSYLLAAWAPTLPWLFAARLISGATAGSMSAATAYIADLTPPAQRAQRFGLIGAVFGLAFVVGPALGGLLGSYGLRLPFIAAAALAAMNCAYGLIVLPESLQPALRQPLRLAAANPVGSLHLLGADRTLGRLAVAWCCAWFALGALQSSFVLSNEVRLGWTPGQNGLALAASGASSALVQLLLLRPVIRRLGERGAALGGYCVAGVAYLCFAFAGTWWLVLLGLGLQAASAVSGPAVQAMVSRQAGPDRQGAAQGALGSVQGLTAIVSPLIAGWLFGAFTGPGAPLWFPGAPFLLASVAYGAACVSISGLPRSAAAARGISEAAG